MRARLALLVLPALVAGSTAPALAAPHASAQTAVDRVELVVTAVPREPRPDVFVLVGTVTPEYARAPAVLQRRNCGGCAWYAADRFDTDARSRFKVAVPTPEIGAGRTCYRVKVPRSAMVRRALSERHCLAPIAG